MSSPIIVMKDGKSVRYTLRGALDSSTASELIEELGKLAGGDTGTILFDVSELDFLSSSGLRAFVYAKQKIGPDVAVEILNPRPRVLNVLRMVGFEDFLTITP